MARIFTSNQVNHVYVVKSVKSSKDAVTSAGDIYVAKDKEGNPFFTYMGKGGLVRTDIIENFMYAKYTLAEKMKKHLKNALITFNPNVSAAAGADYTLNIEMQNPIGISPDNTYIQSAAARCFTSDGDTDSAKKSAVILRIYDSLMKNFSRLESPLFNVVLQLASSTITGTINDYNSSSTSGYAIGSLVKNDGKYYVNKNSIASGAGAGTFDADDWIEIDLNKANLGLNVSDYSANKTYEVGDIVKYNGYLYICDTQISDFESFTAAHWTSFYVDEGSYGNPSEYSSTTPYAVGDRVKRGDSIYVNNTAIVSGESWTAGHWTKVADTKADNSATYKGIMLISLPSEWILGLKQDKPLIYDITSDYMLYPTRESSFDENSWAEVQYLEGTAITNGHAMADLEYFAMGERADQYRMSGWPNYIPTEYMIGSNPDAEYDTISIHYAYVGSNEAVQKSEKEVTFICTPSQTSTLQTKINNLSTSVVIPDPIV